MKKVFTGKSFKVLITIICLLLVFALVTAGNSSVNNFVTSFILTPLQQVTSGASSSVGNALTPPKSAEELQKEVSELQKENQKLNDMLVDYYDIKEENEQLRKYYDIKKENQDFRLVPSTVIERDPNENFYGFTLDKGVLDGVEVNDPVITEKGLVGWVCETAAKSCKVKTILSPDAQIGAVSKKTSDSGVISGSVEYSDDGITLMQNISAQHSMKKGDIVVTSGFGGIYPKNLKIGKIQNIKYDDYSGMPVAVIKPYEDIKNVSSVAVIADFNGKGEISESSQSSQQTSES
ncbi:MAG: rod shape-determining protein MreC [Clostridia bacterium]|nr:rod shape-determining protein MreC [Clostridia bacterium]